MYVPLQVNRSQKCILLIVQYKYIKSCSGDFNSPESDPPHKIMRYWVYYSTQLCFGFPSDTVRWKWFVLAVYQFWKGISAGPALKYFTWFIGAGGVWKERKWKRQCTVLTWQCSPTSCKKERKNEKKLYLVPWLSWVFATQERKKMIWSSDDYLIFSQQFVLTCDILCLSVACLPVWNLDPFRANGASSKDTRPVCMK